MAYQPVFFQFAIGARHGVGCHIEVTGKLADGGKLIAAQQRARGNGMGDGRFDLCEWRLVRIGLQFDDHAAGSGTVGS